MCSVITAVLMFVCPLGTIYSTAGKSDRPAISPQPHCNKEKPRSQREAEPQTRPVEKMMRDQRCHEFPGGAAGLHSICRPHQALLQQREEMRSIECNLFHSA